MGNPAAVKRKKRAKRRKRYEQRLGPGAYLPKTEREQVNAEAARLAAEKKARAEQVKKERAVQKHVKQTTHSATAPKTEKPAKAEKKA